MDAPPQLVYALTVPPADEVNVIVAILTAGVYLYHMSLQFLN